MIGADFHTMQCGLILSLYGEAIHTITEPIFTSQLSVIKWVSINVISAGYAKFLHLKLSFELHERGNEKGSRIGAMDNFGLLLENRGEVVGC